MRTEDISGVWASAAANMRTYILLREKAKAFRADPRVQDALELSRVNGTGVSTLAPGETYDDLVADDDAHFDVEAAGTRGYHYAALDQLALEHLLGTA
jgi:xylose isomerase